MLGAVSTRRRQIASRRPIGAARIAVAVAALIAGCGEPAPPLFEDVSDRAGLDVVLVCGEPGAKQTILEVNGNGVALFDLEGDGDLDVLLVDGSTRAAVMATELVRPHLFRNIGAPEGRIAFERLPDAIPPMRGWPTGVAVADVDADGLDDLLIGGFGEDALFLNRTRGDAVLFTRRPLHMRRDVGSWTTSLALADADNDGQLDAYFARYLDIDPANPPLGKVGDLPCEFGGQTVMCGPHGLTPQHDVFLRGVGAPRWLEPADPERGFAVQPPGYALGVLFQDLDGDGWPDVYVANDSVGNLLFHNQGDGNFVERARPGGVANDGAGRPQAGMGVDAADVDGDGDLDLVVTNFSAEANALYRNEGNLLYRDTAIPSGLATASRALLGWGVHLAELTGDGKLDLLYSNGHVYPQADAAGSNTSYAQPMVLMPGDGTGRFGANVFPDARQHVGRASALGDLDGDGDLDLVALSLDGRPRVYRSRIDAPERQMLVSLEAAPPAHYQALGAQLRVRTAGGWQVLARRSSSGFQSVSDPRLHVAGPGPVLEAEVIWPGGARESLDPAGLRFGAWHLLRQGQGVVASQALREARP